MLNRKHNPAPERGRVDGLFALLHGRINFIGGLFWRNRKRRAALRGFEHLSFDEAGFNRQHVNAVTGEAVA